MSYEQFVEKVVGILSGQAGERFALSVHATLKNNGHERKGIRFSEKGNSVSPTIYMEEYYEKYLRGGDMRGIAAEVLALYEKVRLKHGWGEEAVRDYALARDRIIYKLVNRERNQELLEQAPHTAYLDLAIVFYVLVDVDEPGGQIATMLIRKEHLDWWKVTAEEVGERAAHNTEKLLPYEFSAMCMVIEELLGTENMPEEEWEKLRGQENMYVLTNRARNCGASALLYPGRLDAIGAYFKENYYVLPSSVHEVIVLPESKALPKEEMECVVREVNETQLQVEEFLSDHAYYYDREKQELSC